MKTTYHPLASRDRMLKDSVLKIKGKQKWRSNCKKYNNKDNCYTTVLYSFPPVLWRCWLGSRKGIWPVKTEWWGAGMVICLEWGTDLHIAQLYVGQWHCHSLSLASVKSRLVIPFWYWFTQVVPEKGPLNGCVCCFVHNVTMHAHKYEHSCNIVNVNWCTM